MERHYLNRLNIIPCGIENPVGFWTKSIFKVTCFECRKKIFAPKFV